MKIVQITTDADPEYPMIYALTNKGELLMGMWEAGKFVWKQNITPTAEDYEVLCKTENQ